MSTEWNGSAIMAGFAKIAVDQGLISSDMSPAGGGDHVGNPSADNPEWTRNKATKDYDIAKETGEQLIEKAHSGKCEIADAQGDGAVVEDIVEQQKKDIEIATRMPHGTLVGVHASVMMELLKQADSLDRAGNPDAAKMIDAVVKKMMVKEAFPLLTVGLIAAALGAGAAGVRYGTYFLSTQEDLATDIGDFLEVLDSVMSGFPEFSRITIKVRSILEPHKKIFSAPLPDPDNKKEIAKRLQSLHEFGQTLPTITKLVEGITAGASKWWPFGSRQRLQGQLDTLKTSYGMAMKTIKALEIAGRAAMKISVPGRGGERIGPTPIGAPSNNIAAVQQVLGIKQTNILDEKTKNALKGVELQLEMVLGDVAKKHGWQIQGSLLRNDGTVVEATTLKRIIDLAKERMKSRNG